VRHKVFSIPAARVATVSSAPHCQSVRFTCSRKMFPLHQLSTAKPGMRTVRSIACWLCLRLVHPTSVSLRTAVRVAFDAEGNATRVSQARFSGVSLDAFISPKFSRDWLTIQEFAELKKIAVVLDGRRLPVRLWRALWYHEYGARSYEMDVRWPFVAAGLEALLKTERHLLGDQFRRRTVRLAEELGVTEYDAPRARSAWDMRSGLAHGQNLGTVTPEHLDVYAAMESVLRKAGLRGLRDPDFGAVFDDDARIRDRWSKRG
jgi:hypothetical protein